MRICVIFNPTAKGNKARRFRRQLQDIASRSELRRTRSPGEARLLAAVAVHDGFDAIVAAGGDGTVNEVLNGIGDVPDGFARVWLGVLPLGTVNVFAKELGLPMNLGKAWDAIQHGRARTIDVARAEFTAGDKVRSRFFVQMAGAGLDARAAELVDWKLKQKIGQFAYLVAGLKAMKEPRSMIEVASDAGTASGELVLIGNGRFYAGRLPVFGLAKPDDGLLDACVFTRVNWLTILRYGIGLLTHRAPASRDVRYFQAGSFKLAASSPTPFEVEGETIGQVPATISVREKVLRVIVP